MNAEQKLFSRSYDTEVEAVKALNDRIEELNNLDGVVNVHQNVEKNSAVITVDEGADGTWKSFSLNIIDEDKMCDLFSDAIIKTDKRDLYQVYGQSRVFQENCPIADLSGTVFVQVGDKKYKPYAIFRRPVALEIETPTFDSGDVIEIQCEMQEFNGAEWSSNYYCGIILDDLPQEIACYVYLNLLTKGK